MHVFTITEGGKTITLPKKMVFPLLILDLKWEYNSHCGVLETSRLLQG